MITVFLAVQWIQWIKNTNLLRKKKNIGYRVVKRGVLQEYIES